MMLLYWYYINNRMSSKAAFGNMSYLNNDPHLQRDCEKLGIVTSRPKRREFALLAARIKSYDKWPSDHVLKIEDLAKAGFFFAGYSDCARCFYCGGGLRNWEPEDDVWVEHARWFPWCVFLKQEVGSNFVKAVEALTKIQEVIKYEDVIEKMENLGVSPFTSKEKTIERDPAVLAVIDNGYDKFEVCALALEIRKTGEMLSSHKLYQAAQEKGLTVKNDEKIRSDDCDDTIETLLNRNSDMRYQTTCKVCMDAEVGIVFLPCGHFVTFTECSYSMMACPLCRKKIKGVVRAHLG